MGTGLLCFACSAGKIAMCIQAANKGSPHHLWYEMYGETYVAHLSHDGLLLLTEIVLVVLRSLLVQVLVHLQNLTTGKRW